MTQEITLIEKSVFNQLNLTISHLHPDLECEDYLGYNFQLNQYRIKFRKAKVTPKKNGQFVTLWKRNRSTLQTEPFTTSDPFDFYIIYTELKDRAGFFFFSKQILTEQHIITSPTKEGKRGFRIYPNWDNPISKQAEKTKNWQEKFFIDFSETHHMERIREILSVSDRHHS